MSTPSPNLPAQRAAETVGDFDARVRAAESRIVARDEQVRVQARALFARARHAFSRERLMLPAAGIVTTLGAMWWQGRRPRANTAVGRVDASHRAARSRPALPWTQLLALAWPLVPPAWRSRISPGTAAALASVALPLLGRALGADARPPLSTMAYVDLRRYAGRWFELARLPAPFEGPCTGQPTASYVPRGSRVAVINRCVDRGGRLRTARGVARVVPGSGNARLEVSLWSRALRWLPMAWADYWILHVDDDYDVALVGHPNRRFLWILSRHPELPPSRMQALLQMAAERGYAVNRLKYNVPG
jgi:apolipoprotein D and lipocalin family protein